MKKFGAFFAMLCLGTATTGHAAITIPWWDQAYICRPNPTKCYVSMGAGFDDTLWDAADNCWGMKLICPDALTAGGSGPVPLGRADIVAMRGINRDFDPSVLNGDCFGVRRTSTDGAHVSIDGKMIPVWCNGVLDRVDEVVATGEITLGEQPKCADLAPNGWVAVQNSRCFGKFYDPSEYFIECDGHTDLPSRIVVLNGADYTTGSTSAMPDGASVSKLFDKMISVSKKQRDAHFAQ